MIYFLNLRKPIFHNYYKANDFLLEKNILLPTKSSPCGGNNMFFEYDVRENAENLIYKCSHSVSPRIRSAFNDAIF